MLRDINGNVIPVGKTKRTLEEPFMLGTLPSWLTVTEGTWSIVPPSTDYGYFELETGTAYDSLGRLEVLPNGILMPNVKEISLVIDSLVFSKDSKLYIAIFEQGVKGIQVIDNGSDGVQIIAMQSGVKTTKNVNYWITSNEEYKRKRNFEVRLRSDKTLILLESDIVIFEHQFSDELDINGIIYPQILVQNDNGVGTAQHLRISKVSLSIVHN